MPITALLYADDSKLYHVEIKEGDLPGNQTIIDPAYAKGGNVEHKTNGLLFGLDNWYYNANSGKKYRRENGKWIIGETENRGQWGISHDDYGRLCTNTNSNFINVELYPPGITIRNPNHSFKSPVTARLKNQHTWPSRITSGINRGYLDGFLTKNGYLNNPTAACGSVIYRGDNFPVDFYGNLFLPEPAGNLVKRAIISEQDGIPSVRQAYDKREFFTSTDERSRIVNAYTAPDGTLYFVDFYRGILQHGAYMTTYLRDEILRRNLDKTIGLGRIYRIASDKKKPNAQPHLRDAGNDELVTQLSSVNGWTRDTAQRLIVQRGGTTAIPALRALLDPKSESQVLAKIHALWTLRGLNSLTPVELSQALQSSEVKVVTSAIRAAEVFADSSQSGEVLNQLALLSKRKNSEIQAQLATSIGLFRNTPAIQKKAFATLISILKNSPTGEHRLDDLTLSGLHNAEADFLDSLIAANFQGTVTSDLIAAIIQIRRSKQHR